MNAKRIILPGVIYFVCTVLLRALNIYLSVIENDVSYNESFVSILGFVHGAFLIALYAFAVAAIVYTSFYSNVKKALMSSLMLSFVALCDRVFCLVYDFATESIGLNETETIVTAVIWLGVDFLFFAALYFASAFIPKLLTDKGEKIHGEGGIANAEERKPYPLALLFSCLVMTILQLVSQLIICAQFIVEYDDITSTEWASMAGDVIFVIFRYGVVLFGFSVAFYLIFSHIFSKSAKK